MSKGQRGNKEAKKPKRIPEPTRPIVGGSTPTQSAAGQAPLKK
jgi:hypothetical protein